METTYEVKENDTFYEIARTQMGDPNSFKELQIYNNLLAPLAEPGTEIKIPPIANVIGDQTEQKEETSSSVVGQSNLPEPPKGRSYLDSEIEFFITNLNTGTKIRFGISPESVSDSFSAQFDDEFVRGRSSPFKGYSGSGPRDISFSLKLYADYCPEGIVQTVRMLRALAYAEKDGVIRPPRCYFSLGTFMQITGVPTSVNVIWEKPYKEGIYSFATVSLSIQEVEEKSRIASEVETGV